MPKPARSEVIDEVPYASPDDVLKHIRNRDSFTDPGRNEAISMLMDRSDFVDDRVGKAWRRREVTEWDTQVKLSHLQKHQRHRRRSRYKSGRRTRDPTKLADPFAPVQLPYLNITSIQKLVLLRGRNYDDITADGFEDVTSEADMEDAAWYLQPGRGRIQISLRALTIGGVSTWGRSLVDDATARVTFRYGEDESTSATEASNGTISGTSAPNTTSEGVSESVPDAIRDAVAKLVASDIARMDNLGDMFRSSGENIDLSDAADTLRSDAMETIQNHRREV